MTSLLEYLQKPNPKLKSYCGPGNISVNHNWSHVTGREEWRDFTYENLLSCYGRVLETEMLPETLPTISPRLTKLEREIWNEEGLRFFLGRSVLAEVTAALKIAFSDLYPDINDPPEIRVGGYARSQETSDRQLYPDWATIRQSYQDNVSHYVNLCPGETKVAAKWKSTDKGTVNWNEPWRQAQTYAGELCKTRYGYILTDEELVVFRVRVQEIGEGLAASRGRRNQMSLSTTYDRRTSELSQLSSLSSGLSRMSVSEYQDDNSRVEFGPMEYRAILWGKSGNRMTVKLALWWIHMMASVPRTEKSVQSGYPPLDSWTETAEGFAHTSTGQVTWKIPKEAIVLGEQGIMEPHESEDLFVEDIAGAEYDKRGWKLFTKKGKIIKQSNQPRLRRRKDGKWYTLKKTGLEDADWVREDE